MAKRARKAQREKISLKMQLRHYYGYAEYYGGASPFTSLQLINGGAEAAEDIDVVIEGEGGFLLPFSRHFDELPFESAAEIAAADLASPLYLAELAQTQVVQVCVRALRGKETLAEEKGEVTLLPLDMWCGRSGSAEQLACFVRPRLADCLRILEEARAQLKKWEIPCEWNGYAEGDKNKLRKMAAAVTFVFIGFIAKKIIDVGTGAGFPGIPLKIYCPALKVVLIDSLAKRLNFLQRVIDELGLTDIECVHLRAEDAGKNAAHREKYDIVTARAVARLSVLSEYCLPLVKVGGMFVALKGAKYKEEIAAAGKALYVLGGKLVSAQQVELPGLDDGRAVVTIKKVKASPKAYPRKAGLPEKNPLE